MHSLGRTDLAERYFDVAERNLDKLPTDQWESDRAFGLINLARAKLRSADYDIAEVGSLLTKASLIVTRSPTLRKKQHAVTITRVLAEVWAHMQSLDIHGYDHILQSALQLARTGNPIQRACCLVEIARRQAAIAGKDVASKTLSEAQNACEEGSGVVRALVQANLLLGRALCGLNDTLQIDIEAARNSFTDEAHGIVGRADVERLLRLPVPDLPGAEEALNHIGDVRVRAKAARNIARQYAATGDYKSALRVVAHKIGAKRSEFVPGVAEAVAVHARTNQIAKDKVRPVLFELLLESALHLDGTYRVIADIIRSGAVDLDSKRLESLVETLGLDTVSQDLRQLTRLTA
jgi:hypothetical protein